MLENISFFPTKREKNHLIITTEKGRRGELAWCPNSFVWDCSRNNGHSPRVEDPVEAFIDKLREGQETMLQFTLKSFGELKNSSDCHYLSFSNSRENLLSGQNSLRDFESRFKIKQASLTQIKWLIYSKTWQGG